MSCARVAPALLRVNPITVRSALAGSKYILQHLLSNQLSRLILIGPTEKKLNYGIKDASDAEFFGVMDLRNYLVKKKVDTLTFNLWYETKVVDQGSEARDQELHEVIDHALPFLQETITKQLQLFGG